MPIVAILAPIALSFAVKVGLRLAARAAKALMEGGAAASSPTATASTTSGPPSGQTFAATLKDQEARIPVAAVPVSPAPVAPASDALPLAQVAYQQGVRSFALGAQTRARIAWPEAGRQAYHPGSAHRRPSASPV